MAEQYKGNFFKVGDDTTWTLTDSFTDALETFYSLKNSGMDDVKITDAITGKTIKR